MRYDKLWMAAIILAGVGCGALMAAEKYAIKAVRANPWQTVVSCVSGETPDVAKLDGAVIVSCPGRLQSK